MVGGMDMGNALEHLLYQLHAAHCACIITLINTLLLFNATLLLTGECLGSHSPHALTMFKYI